MHTPARFLLLLTLLGLAVVGPASAQDLDVLGLERQECWDLRRSGQLDESFSCAADLWERRDELSVDGRVDVLSLMAQLYSISGATGDARRCYEAILALDPHWLPENFDAMPTAWREPILAAYEERGFQRRSQGARNIAVLDFEVADLAPDDIDMDGLAQALPTFISAFLEEALEGASLKDDDAPLRLVSYRDRGPLMGEMASAMEMQQGAVLHAEAADRGSLLEAGKLQAVQGFLAGSVVRDFEGKVQVAFYLLDVETGEARCAQTERGKAKDLFKILQKSLASWASCAIEGAELKDKGGAESLGPVAQGVAALERYHDALQLAEAGRYAEALELAQGALELRPDAEDLERLVQVLQDQQEMSGLALQGSPPPVDLQ